MKKKMVMLYMKLGLCRKKMQIRRVANRRFLCLGMAALFGAGLCGCGNAASSDGQADSAKTESVSSLETDLAYDIDAYKEKLADGRVPISDCRTSYEADIATIQSEDYAKLNFDSCEFAEFPDAGVILETPGFIPYYSGFKNLMVLARIRNRVDAEGVRRTMKRVGLDADSRLPVKKYSLGMRQRLGIAQAIMEDQKVLILDEPMNGLDRHGVADVRKLLLELKGQGRTILLASHNSEDIRMLCDKIFEMEAGRLV